MGKNPNELEPEKKTKLVRAKFACLPFWFLQRKTEVILRTSDFTACVQMTCISSNID